jgi:hypothetical protein
MLVIKIMVNLEVVKGKRERSEKYFHVLIAASTLAIS